MSQIPKYSLDFLKKIESNNNREWFHANKEEYLKAQQGIVAFADNLLAEMQKHRSLSHDEQTALDQLMEEAQHLMLSKSEAFRLLAQRGHTVFSTN